MARIKFLWCSSKRGERGSGADEEHGGRRDDKVSHSIPHPGNMSVLEDK